MTFTICANFDHLKYEHVRIFQIPFVFSPGKTFLANRTVVYFCFVMLAIVYFQADPTRSTVITTAKENLYLETFINDVTQKCNFSLSHLPSSLHVHNFLQHAAYFCSSWMTSCLHLKK